MRVAPHLTEVMNLFDTTSVAATADDGVQLELETIGGSIPENCSMDDLAGVVTFPDDLDVEVPEQVRYESFRAARLLYGLWVEFGPFQIDEAGVETVPLSIARAGKPAIAAWVSIAGGVERSRSEVQEILELENRRTLSNYIPQYRYEL